MRVYSYQPAAVLTVSGDDAAAFLQGQFTNELRQPVGAVVYGLWLTQKGKVLADSHVLRRAESEFQLVSLNSLAAAIKPRLEEYIVADDVTLAEATAGTWALALSGPGCGERLYQVLGEVPLPGRFLQARGLSIFAGRRMIGENYELIGQEKSIVETRQKLLAVGGQEIDAAEMEFARIMDGIPRIPLDIGPGDLPNEGGLEATAISFTKGCYLGQEVMARLKNMGQIRRRLHVIQGAGTPPATLASLYQGEHRVGQVRSVAVHGGDGFAALAMLSLVNLEPAAGLSLAPGAAATVRIVPHG